MMDKGNEVQPMGVLLMAYGTPETPDQVEAYYTHIRGGRKPSPEAVEHLRERYMLVGGKTPLLEITNEVASKLQEKLRAGGGNWNVYAGMKHWYPYIGEVMEQMAADGVQKAVAFALAPHCSRISLGGYRKAVDEAAEKLGSRASWGSIPFVKCWHHNGQWRAMMAELVREGLANFAPEERGSVTVLFSAHSLPERIRTWDDPYERQLMESSAAVAKIAGVSNWRFAFQSAGNTGEPWLGPDIVDYLEVLHKEGVHNVLSVPIGFVADHLEILFDIDIEAQQKAKELDITLHRTQMPNARPDFIDALASVVEENLHAPTPCWCYPDLLQVAPLAVATVRD